MVRIIQLLCPARHCILATAYESTDGAVIPQMEQRLLYHAKTMVEAGAMNPWCGLCRSRDWHPEDRPTKYASMDEALPYLQEIEDRNAQTREFFRAGKN